MSSTSTDVPTIAELAKRSLLRPLQRQRIAQSIKTSRDLLDQQHMLQNVYGVGIDVPQVQRNLEADERTLELGTAPDYSMSVKNRLNKMRVALEQSMTHDMLTEDQMERPTAANVDSTIAWQDAHKQHVLAWKTICRILDPNNDNPNFTNIERLRTNTPPKGDPRRYWQGFDAVSWGEDVTEELLGAIDDSDYTRFLEMKVLEWTKFSICRELAWSDAEYKAAVERFRRSGHPTDADAERLLQEEGLAHLQVPMETEPGHDPMPPKRKRKLLDSEVWPIPQVRQREMTIAQFSKLSGIATVRMSTVCGANPRGGGWREDETAKILKAFEAYDMARAGADATAAQAVSGGAGFDSEAAVAATATANVDPGE